MLIPVTMASNPPISVGRVHRRNINVVILSVGNSLLTILSEGNHDGARAGVRLFRPVGGSLDSVHDLTVWLRVRSSDARFRCDSSSKDSLQIEGRCEGHYRSTLIGDLSCAEQGLEAGD